VLEVLNGFLGQGLENGMHFRAGDFYALSRGFLCGHKSKGLDVIIQIRFNFQQLLGHFHQLLVIGSLAGLDIFHYFGSLRHNGFPGCPQTKDTQGIGNGAKGLLNGIQFFQCRIGIPDKQIQGFLN